MEDREGEFFHGFFFSYACFLSCAAENVYAFVVHPCYMFASNFTKRRYHMTIKIGDKIPSVTLKRLGANGLEDFNITDHLKGRTVIMFGLPGAYTPVCTSTQVPGYIENSAAIKENGVSEVLCVSVNDPFVMKHWGEFLGADGKVTMISDGNAELSQAMGLTFDSSHLGFGTVRSRRYSMIIQDGVVTHLEIEDKPNDLTGSSAEACLVNLAKKAA
jgi:peroxiredoxin